MCDDLTFRAVDLLVAAFAVPAAARQPSVKHGRQTGHSGPLRTAQLLA